MSDVACFGIKRGRRQRGRLRQPVSDVQQTSAVDRWKSL